VSAIFEKDFGWLTHANLKERLESLVSEGGFPRALSA
jgi:hypothetical protein